jgi:outer membrane protein with beta-barrel domain
MIRRPAIAALLCLLSRPTAAQIFTPLELSGGYSFVRDPRNDVSLPIGWMAGGGVTLNDWLSAVADVSGNHKTIAAFGSDVHISVHTAMAGVRGSVRVGRLMEFAQVLVGVVRGSGTAFGFTSTTNALGVQPGLGVDYPLNQRLAGRAQFDVRFIHSQPDGNDPGYEYRFVAGIVYRLRR